MQGKTTGIPEEVKINQVDRKEHYPMLLLLLININPVNLADSSTVGKNELSRGKMIGTIPD